MGLIVRTAGEGHPAEDFEADMGFLLSEWNRIQRVADSAQAPALVHEETVIAHRLIRDIYTPEVSEVLVDNRRMYECIREYIRATIPDVVPQVKLAEATEPLFKSHGIDTEISNLRLNQIWLHCGGYIVIDEAEALTAIDVNTGSFVGERHLEDTVFATNLEAATAIARQIRLRDLGGIIIIDFIDMQLSENRERVLSRLEECLQKDRSRSQILDITKLGLVEMTRKRVRKSLNRFISQECPYCKGSGSILSADTMVILAMRKLENLCRESYMKEIRLYVHPDVANRIVEERHDDIERMEKEFRKTIRIMPAATLHFEDLKDVFSYDKASMLGLT
jgi:ribonuclease G